MKKRAKTVAFPKQAIILAAGLGTRLRPITQNIPKPALPLGGWPILFYNLCLLRKAGVTEITINLFHQPKALRQLFQNSKFGFKKIHFSLEKKILGTAGGIAKALRQMKPETTYVLNGDILTDIDLKKIYQQHQSTESLATLAVVNPNRIPVDSFIHYSKKGAIEKIGPWVEGAVKQSKLNHGVFAGIHVIEPEPFRPIPTNVYSCVIRDVYQKLLNQGAMLSAYYHNGTWWDLGHLETLKTVDHQIWEGSVSPEILEMHREVKRWPLLNNT